MNRKALLRLAILLLASPVIGEEPPLLDLETCLREAIEAGPGLAAVRKSQEANQAELALARSELQPKLAAEGSLSGKSGLGSSSAISATANGASLGLSGEGGGSLTLSLPLSTLALSASQSLPSEDSGSAPTTRVGLNLSQTIWEGYAGGGARAGYEKSLLDFRGKELVAERARKAALAEAKKAFVALLAAQRARDLAASTALRQERLLAQTRRLRELGQATELGLREDELGARDKALALRQAEADLRAARRALALLMGRPADAEFRAKELPDPSLPAASLTEALGIGRERRSDGAALELKLRAARIDLALIRGKAEASLSLRAGTAFAFRGGDEPSQAAQASASLVLGLPLLDGGSLAAQVAANRAAAEVLEAEAARLGEAIASEISAAYEAALIKRERASLSAELAALAEAKLGLVEAQFGFGAASLEDRRGALDDLVTAQGARLKAGNDYLLAVLALETAMGL